MATAPPLASIGLVADVQYADIDDGASFDGSERRCYRRALEHAAAAGAAFRAARCRGLAPLRTPRPMPAPLLRAP